MSTSLYQTYASRTPSRGYHFHLLAKGQTNPKMAKLADELGILPFALSLAPFNVSGRGNLQQVVMFLYKFYSADFLHRIERLSINPIKDTRQLDVSFTVEAVSLPGSANVERLPDRTSERLALAHLDDYTEPILERNLFGPPNSSPRIAGVGLRSTSSTRTYRPRTVR